MLHQYLKKVHTLYIFYVDVSNHNVNHPRIMRRQKKTFETTNLRLFFEENRSPRLAK